jgi:hypothetical protein
MTSENIIFDPEIFVIDLKLKLKKAMADFFEYNANQFVKDREEIIELTENFPDKPDTYYNNYIIIVGQGRQYILADAFEKAGKVPDDEPELNNGNYCWRAPKGNMPESEFGKILTVKGLKDLFT